MIVNIYIIIDNVTIQKVQKTKFLGVIITIANSILSWKEHIKLYPII